MKQPVDENDDDDFTISSDDFTISSDDPELKKQPTTFVTKLVNDVLLGFEERYSSWEKMKKVVATILRWKRAIILNHQPLKTYRLPREQSSE